MDIVYKEIDKSIEEQIVQLWGDWVTKYNCLHYGEGCYSLAALADGVPVGFISVYPLQLPKPLDMYHDAYIASVLSSELHARIWRYPYAFAHSSAMAVNLAAIPFLLVVGH